MAMKKFHKREDLQRSLLLIRSFAKIETRRENCILITVYNLSLINDLIYFITNN